MPEIKSIRIEPVQLEGMDRRRADFVAQSNSQPAPRAMFVVKLYLSGIELMGGQGVALYVGNEWVRKYYAFSGGIYFNVYDETFLAKNVGATLRFTSDHESFHDTGVALPSAVNRHAVAAAEGVDDFDLPTKADVLKS